MHRPPWFVTARDRWGVAEVVLDEDESHHALRVLRLQPTDELIVTDGRGAVALCSVARVEDGRVVAAVLGSEIAPAMQPQIAVYQGAAKHGKLDSVVERLAEVGVAEMSVFTSERAVVRWDESKLDRMTVRWEKLARSAAKQSRNPWQMVVGRGLSWSGLIKRIESEPGALVLWEEASRSLRSVLDERAERVALVAGPEGGLTAEEAEALAAAGARLVSLGPRILRTENAALIAASVVLYHYGIIG